MVSAQSPTEQIAERVAEAAPGLAVATQLEAVQSFRTANADYRKRVNDAHRWQAAASGMADPGGIAEDPVGNLVVTGDVYGSNAAEIIAALQSDGKQQAQVAPSTPAAQASSTWAQTMGKAALVTAGLLGSGGIGAGVPWLLGAYSKPGAVSTTVVQPADSQRLGISVVPGGAMTTEAAK